VPGLLGHLEDPEGVDDDPHDWEEAKRRPLGGRVHGLADRHRVDGDSHHSTDPEGDLRGPLRLHPEDAQQQEERQQW
jgi:hypothetical protein